MTVSVTDTFHVTVSRDCHQRMMKEIDLDWGMMEMVDGVYRQVMKDFESKDRRLMFERMLI